MQNFKLGSVGQVNYCMSKDICWINYQVLLLLFWEVARLCLDVIRKGILTLSGISS